MKGKILKKVTTTVVAASIIAAALTVDTADAISVCAQDVSSGDSEILDTPDIDNVSLDESETPADAQTPEQVEPEMPADAQTPEQVEPETPTDAQTPEQVEPETPEGAQTPEQTEPAPLAEPEPVSAITVTGTPDATYEYDGQDHSFQVMLDSTGVGADGETYDILLTNFVSVSARNVSQNTFEISDLSDITVFKAGTTDVVIPASITVNAEMITKRNVTLRSMNLLKTYDGSPLENKDTPLAEETGWVSGEGANYAFTGSRTAIGTDINAFTVVSGKDGTDLNNYNINCVFGAITVVERLDDQKYIITVEAGSATTKYSGKDQPVTGYVLEGRSDSEFQVNGTGDPTQVLTVTIGNAVFSVTGIAASGSGKNAGTYTVNISGSPIVMDSQGNDVTSQFKFEFKPGKLEIEKRKVILTSASLTKKYTKDTITKHSVTVSGDGFVEGEGATYTYTGKQKGVGESYNYFSYKLNDGTLADNYDIEKVPGKLKIKKQADVAINEEPKSNDSGNNDNNNDSQGNEQVQADNKPAQADKVADNTAEQPTAQAQVPENENVLGAKRDSVTVDIKNPKKGKKKSKKKGKNSKEVLGARRGSTEDNTDIGRHIFVFAAAVIFMAALKIKRKKSIRR